MDEKKRLRNYICENMIDIAQKDEKVVTVSADLYKTCRMDLFLEQFPDRVYNVGIAEQNMIGFSAGLCHEGFKPYAFSMAPFISMRACEQCRTDIAYGNLNVKMIGIYAGVSGGLSGATHWAIEDCGIMSAIPNITILEPSDVMQLRKMLMSTLEYDAPCYIRVGVLPVNDIYEELNDYQIGKANYVISGKDGAIICSGVVVQNAVAASKEIYEETGKKIAVYDMHTIKPIDKVAIRNAAKTGALLVAQDHNVIGGLGYQVAAVIAEERLDTKFKIIGITDKFVPMARQEYLYSLFKLDVNGIKEEFLSM